MDGSLRESKNGPQEGRKCRYRHRGAVTPEQLAEAWERLTPIEQRRFRRLTGPVEPDCDRIARLQAEADELLASCGGVWPSVPDDQLSEQIARLQAECAELVAEYGLDNPPRPCTARTIRAFRSLTSTHQALFGLMLRTCGLPLRTWNGEPMRETHQVSGLTLPPFGQSLRDGNVEPLSDETPGRRRDARD